MAEAQGAPQLFDVAAAQLAELSSLSLAEARGTLRLACRDAGLRTDLITLPKLKVLLARVLPRELALRGVAGAEAACAALASKLEQAAFSPAAAEPADLFLRIRNG
jgi:hypothetical protein